MLIISRQKFYYTASGIIIPVGGRPVHRLRVDSLNLCTGRPPTECDDTRRCIIKCKHKIKIKLTVKKFLLFIFVHSALVLVQPNRSILLTIQN